MAWAPEAARPTTSIAIVEREQQLQGLGVELVVVGEQDSDGLRSAGVPRVRHVQHLLSRVAVTRKSVETPETCTFVANPSLRGVQKSCVLGTIRLSACGSASSTPRTVEGARLAAVTSAGRAAGLEPLELAADSLAAAALYERHSGRVFGYCLSRLGRREDAEDAVQTTFLHAVRGLRRGVVPATEIAWLLGIARNVCLTRWESVGRRSRLESPCDPVKLERGRAAPQGRREELIGLEDALSQLPEQQRRAVLLRDWRGLSYEEIAAQLGVSRAAVETLIFRGRRTLAELLREEPRATRRRLRSLGDLGSFFSAIKTALTGGAAATKIAIAAATAVALSGTGAVVVTSGHGAGHGSGRRARRRSLRRPAPVASVAPAPSSRCRRPTLPQPAAQDGGRRRALLSPPSPPRATAAQPTTAADAPVAAAPADAGRRKRSARRTPSSEPHGQPHAIPSQPAPVAAAPPARGAAAGRDRSGGADRRAAAADPACHVPITVPPITVPPITVPPVTVTVPPITVPPLVTVPPVTVTLPPIVRRSAQAPPVARRAARTRAGIRFARPRRTTRGGTLAS